MLKSWKSDSSHISDLCQILMNAKQKQHVNARNANARIPGVVMTAAAVEIFCICESMTRVSVSIISSVSCGIIYSWLLLKYVDLVYTGKNFNTDINWGFVSIIIIALAAAGYALYQYRIRVCLTVMPLLNSIVLWLKVVRYRCSWWNCIWYEV